MNTIIASPGRRGTALLASLMLLIVAFSLVINMIDLGSANVRNEALRESDVRSYADAMSAANYCMDYLVTNATAAEMPAAAGTAQVDLTQITYAGASLLQSPFTADTTHKANQTWDKVPNINSSKLAWVKVTPMTAGQPYYLIKVDSEGYTTNNKYIALGSDVDQAMLRGADMVVTVTVPSLLTTQTGIATAMNADSNYSFNSVVDWWNSTWNGSNTGSAYSYGSKKNSVNPTTYTLNALVQAYGAAPYKQGSGTVNSSPQYAQSSSKVPSFTYASPSAAFGNITTGGTPLPAGAVDINGNLVGNVTLIAGQSYHFNSISSTATITIDNGSNPTKADPTATPPVLAPTAEIYCDGLMNLSNPLVYNQNNTVLQLYSGDPGTSFNYNGNTAFGATQYPPGRFIWATSANEVITMNGNGTFGGVFIAPNATMELKGNFTMYGAMLVGTMAQVTGSFALLYDSQLASQQYTLPAVMSATNIQMKMNMWRTR